MSATKSSHRENAWCFRKKWRAQAREREYHNRLRRYLVLKQQNGCRKIKSIFIFGLPCIPVWSASLSLPLSLSSISSRFFPFPPVSSRAPFRQNFKFQTVKQQDWFCTRRSRVDFTHSKLVKLFTGNTFAQLCSTLSKGRYS